jgi:adenine phosphoribosyltransferase
MDLKKIVTDYPDFPKKGIIFKDIWPLLEDPNAFEYILSVFQKQYNNKADAIAGIESRGFVFGAALANRMKLSFVPIRKKGKLPGKTLGVDYEIEYGNASMEIQKNILKNKKKIVIVDDLLATGGTSEAAIKLFEKIGLEIIGLAFVIELKFLGGRKKINKYEIFSMVSYD